MNSFLSPYPNHCIGLMRILHNTAVMEEIFIPSFNMCGHENVDLGLFRFFFFSSFFIWMPSKRPRVFKKYRVVPKNLTYKHSVSYPVWILYITPYLIFSLLLLKCLHCCSMHHLVLDTIYLILNFSLTFANYTLLLYFIVQTVYDSQCVAITGAS